MLRSRPGYPARAGGRGVPTSSPAKATSGKAGDGLAGRTARSEEVRCAEPHLEPPSGHWKGFLPQTPGQI